MNVLNLYESPERHLERFELNQIAAGKLQNITATTLFNGENMIRAAISFFILALVAYVLGANGIAGLSVEIGKTLLVVFLALAVISFLVSLVTGKKTQRLP
jgi:uncharacterized membrane protein YtjA (UPF0391 family)